MASDINYASIDENYPIAGKDNDSQGFRDNFKYIRNSLESAKSEIEDLQSNTAKKNTDNDFNFNTISGAKFVNCGDTVNSGGIISNNTTIDYTDGSLQIFEVSASITMILSNFPEDKIAAHLRVHLTSLNSVSHTVTFDVENGSIKKDSSTSNPITVDSSSNPIVIDFWTHDGGNKIYMHSHGKFT